jgi:hypothetical protein
MENQLPKLGTWALVMATTAASALPMMWSQESREHNRLAGCLLAVSVATRNRALTPIGDKHSLSTQSEGWMASMAGSEVADAESGAAAVAFP